ncbi:MAG: helix-turn-helix domain-containing GNAT family N-acetyltransferase [Halopseudomonas aestusnigri]
MSESGPDIINEIRRASRILIREFGLLNRTLAGTDFSVSFVHAMIDIGNAGTLTAKDLSENLLLEKSTISRMVKKLVSRGEIIETASPTDSRQKDLKLTPQGQLTLEEISKYAEIQVKNAISPLTNMTRQKVLNGLEIYSEALTKSRLTQDVNIEWNSSVKCQVVEGYSLGLVGRIVEMHAIFYGNFANFNAVFETTVAKGLVDFIPRINHQRNSIWYAVNGNKVVGSIVIDGEDLGSNIAHLRWFIVDEEVRGSGVGKALFSEAIKFCDASGFEEIHLWTFKGLDAARKLYESSGFDLVDEHPGDQWGKQVLEQKFVRTCTSS